MMAIIKQHNPTRLLIFLGNYGKEYTFTNHNFGFEILWSFLDSKYGLNVVKTLDNSIVCLYELNRAWLVAAKEGMNITGESLHKIEKIQELEKSDSEIFLFYDEVYINFPCVRVKKNHNNAGHNGVSSIMQYFKTVIKIQCGIGPQIGDLCSFVHRKIDTKIFKNLQQKYNELVYDITDGMLVELLMNKYNNKLTWDENI